MIAGLCTPDALYDVIGRSYSTTRRADPQIAAVIRAAIGDAATVANVGAGSGAYEPGDVNVIAIEPSAVMIAQRPAGSAPVLQASAEKLPLADDSVDVAMAVISDHHWTDRQEGLREMRRVARKRVVVLNADPGQMSVFWLTRDYIRAFADLVPSRHRKAGAWQRDLRDHLGQIDVAAVPVPHDCWDGFYQAYWRRPHAYLDPNVRANISVFQRVPATDVAPALGQLERDLATGAWRRRHADLLTRTQLDVGMRLVVANLARSRRATSRPLGQVPLSRRPAP